VDVLLRLNLSKPLSYERTILEKVCSRLSPNTITEFFVTLEAILDLGEKSLCEITKNHGSRDWPARIFAAAKYHRQTLSETSRKKLPVFHGVAGDKVVLKALCENVSVFSKCLLQSQQTMEFEKPKKTRKRTQRSSSKQKTGAAKRRRSIV
jgi:hypothetical protein